MLIFQMLNHVAIGALVDVADAVLEVVRVGLPQQPLTSVSVRTLEQPGMAGSSFSSPLLKGGSSGTSQQHQKKAVGWMAEIVGEKKSTELDAGRALARVSSTASQRQRYTLADFPIGLIVSILSPSSNWRECKVNAHEDEDEEGGEDAAIQVHYEGYESRHDEWIGLETDSARIRFLDGNGLPSDAPPISEEDTEAPPVLPASPQQPLTDAKVMRAKIFHLCVVTVATIASRVDRKERWTPETLPLSETDKATLNAAKTLQASWEHVWDVCDLCETGIYLADREAARLRQALAPSSKPTPSSQSKSDDEDVFGDFLRSALGVHCARPELAQYTYVAYVLDALVRFKQCLSGKRLITHGSVLYVPLAALPSLPVLLTFGVFEPHCRDTRPGQDPATNNVSTAHNLCHPR